MSTPSHHHWKIVERRGREGLKLLEADWKRLYAAMPLRTVFHAYETHAAYLECLAGAPGRFRFLVLTDGRQVRAICPLEARMDRTLGLPLRVWGTPHHPHWPLSDVICPEDEARRALLPAVADFLKAGPGARRLLAVGPLPQKSVIWEGLRSLPQDAYCAHVALEPFVFDCERSFDELMSRLSKRFRSHLRTSGNRLASRADVRLETADDAAELAPLFDAFVSVEASGWKGENGTRSAIRLHPSYLSFYRGLARTFGGRDGCEINALFAEGRCIAGEFCMRTGEEYACLKSGYDESYARLSPGHLLLARTLERCCLDPQIKRFNQLSDASWLGVWHPDTVALQQVHVALGKWSGPPLTAAWRFRFGPGRRMMRWLRGGYGELRNASPWPLARSRSHESARAGSLRRHNEPD